MYTSKERMPICVNLTKSYTRIECVHTFPRLVLYYKKVVRKTRFVYKSPVFSKPYATTSHVAGASFMYVYFYVIHT